MTKKAENIIKSIDKAFRALAKETGSTFISASFIEGAVMIDDYTDLSNKKFSYFEEGQNNE